jgi:uncharacterized protein (TIGR04255 family)
MPDYRFPPVFEVVLDVVPIDTLSEESLQALPAKLQPHFGPPQRIESSVLEIQVKADKSQNVSTQRAFQGWRFDAHPPSWVLQALRERFTLNYVRPVSPASPAYVGWEAIYARFLDTLGLLREHYSPLPLRRVGLRYINRLALPDRTPLSRWLNIGVQAPDLLGSVHAFQLKQTWGQVAGFEGLAATVNLAKVEDADAARAGLQTVVLDIDLFNLYPKDAPLFDELAQWFDLTHRAENQIFESFATDALRSLLEPVAANANR